MKKSLWLLAAVLLVVLAGCSGSNTETTDEKTTQTVDKNGGTVTAKDGTKIDIPAGATGDTPVTITVEQTVDIDDAAAVEKANLKNAEGTKIIPVGDVVSFGPEGTVFEKPVSVTLPYDAAKAVGKKLGFFWTKLNDLATYELIDGAEFTDGKAKAGVNHFSNGFVGYVEYKLPEGLVFEPANLATEVSIARPIIVTYTEILNETDLAFELKLGDAKVEGFGHLAIDSKSYAFFPKALLTPNSSYTIYATIGGKKYSAEFATVADAGTNPLASNAKNFSFTVAPTAVLNPKNYEKSIMDLFTSASTAGEKPLFSPILVKDLGSGKYEFTLAYGDGSDFDGDSKAEVNHTAWASRMKGTMHGKYFVVSGPFTLSQYVSGSYMTTNIDNVFLYGALKDDGSGGLAVEGGFGGVYTKKCSDVVNFWDNLGAKVVLSQMCTPVVEDLFAYGTYSVAANAIDQLTFSVTGATQTAIEVTSSGKLDAKYAHINDLDGALFELYQGTTLKLTSSGLEKPISSEFTKEADGWYTFTKITFNIPEEKKPAAGTYTLRFIVGLYGLETSVEIK